MAEKLDKEHPVRQKIFKRGGEPLEKQVTHAHLMTLSDTKQGRAMESFW